MHHIQYVYRIYHVESLLVNGTNNYLDKLENFLMNVKIIFLQKFMDIMIEYHDRG